MKHGPVPGKRHFRDKWRKCVNKTAAKRNPTETLTGLQAANDDVARQSSAPPKEQS
jgi:hypothetical protein